MASVLVLVVLAVFIVLFFQVKLIELYGCGGTPSAAPCVAAMPGGLVTFPHRHGELIRCCLETATVLPRFEIVGVLLENRRHRRSRIDWRG